MSRMPAVKRLQFMLALAMTVLVTPRLQAQQPADPQPSPLPLNQPSTFRYTDAQGFGSITLTDVGPDSATGGHLLRVTIIQNGVRYDGSGLTYFLASEPRPLNNLITFTVRAPGGQAYFYQGKMGLGVEFQGSGTFHPVTDPTQSATWGLLFTPGVPPPPPGPPSTTLTLNIDRGCGSGYPIGGPIFISLSASANDTLTLLSQRGDGSQFVLFANQPVLAGRTYSFAAMVANLLGQRTLILRDAQGVQTTCSFTGINRQ